MRSLKIAGLACLLVMLAAGVGQAETAHSMVDRAVDLARAGQTAEAMLLLTKAIGSGDLRGEDLLLAYRNRAATGYLLFADSYDKAKEESDEKKREVYIKACALGLAMARRDAKKVLEMNPGDEGAETILAEVGKAMTKIGLTESDFD